MTTHRLGRPRALSRDQEAEVIRRYELWYANQPKRLADELGVSHATISVIVRRSRTGEASTTDTTTDLSATCSITTETPELLNNSKETS
jgi:hypothetical protein